jgi:hypothetical protein
MNDDSVETADLAENAINVSSDLPDALNAWKVF